MSNDPLSVFRAAVEALERENWHRIASLCDAESLAAFKQELLETLAPPAGNALKLTATELMKAVPNMPRAVAEYQVSRFRETLDPRRRLKQEIPGAESREALERMPPAEVFALWLEGRSLRRQLDREVDRKHMSRATANELLTDGRRPIAFTPLGFVNEGEELAHVVYRTSTGHRLQTATAKRQANGDWLLLADRGLLTMNQIRLTPDIGEDATLGL